MAPIKPLNAEQVSALIEEQALSREDLFDSLRQVMEIRALEDSISSLLTKGVLKGASHLYGGEEAVDVGAVSALRDDDLITSALCVMLDRLEWYSSSPPLIVPGRDPFDGMDGNF